MLSPEDLWLCSPINVTPVRFSQVSTELSPYSSKTTPFRFFDSDGFLITALFDDDSASSTDLITSSATISNSSSPSSQDLSHPSQISLLSPFRATTNTYPPSNASSSPLPSLILSHRTQSDLKPGNRLFDSPLTPLTDISFNDAHSCSSLPRRFTEDFSSPSISRKKTNLKRRQESPLILSDADADYSPESSPLPKKSRTTVVAQDDDDDETGQIPPMRTFPTSGECAVQIKEDVFPLFYRQFYVSGEYKSSDNKHLFTRRHHPNGNYNPPRHGPFDLYTPRYVKGSGHSKVGLCPICFEPKARGGEGKKVWLGMKVSAFKCYHLQYAHGISPVNGLPFSPPLDFRIVALKTPTKLKGGAVTSISKPPLDCSSPSSSTSSRLLTSKKKVVGRKAINIDSLRTHIMQGFCHCCKKWVPVEGVKDVENKVKELFWWKHAASCHKGSKIEGESDVYVQDDVFRRLQELESAEQDPSA